MHNICMGPMQIHGASSGIGLQWKLIHWLSHLLGPEFSKISRDKTCGLLMDVSSEHLQG